jgi:ABC-2 type transport system permease protein
MFSLRQYTFVGRIAARQQWAYRGELLMRSISMILFMGIFVALWHTAFAVRGGEALAGYTLVDIVWYLAMTETITLSSSRAFITISEAVKSGDLAYTLTRPVSYPFFQVAHSLGDAVPRFVLNFLTASLVVVLGVGAVAGNWQGVLSFLVMAWLALLLDALIAVLIGLSAFWLDEVMPVFWIYQKLLFTVGGLFLPLEMFPAWLQRISAWLPFRFVANAPARAFVAFDAREVMGMVLGQVIYIVILTGAVMLVWRMAQKRMVMHGG